jgi:hypothetical protein
MKKKPNKPLREVPVTDRKTGAIWQAKGQISKKYTAAGLEGTNQGAEGKEADLGLNPQSDRTGIKKPAGASAKGSEARNLKRKEIETIEDYVDAFFAGRTKTLSDEVARRISRVKFGDDQRRAELIRVAAESDPLLEKSRQLLMVALPSQTFGLLRAAIREFARDVIACRMNGVLDVTPWLVQANDERRQELAVLWEKLQSAPPKSERESRVTSLPGNGETSADDDLSADAKRASTDEQRLVRNVFFAAVLWGYSERPALPQLIRELRSTVFAVTLDKPELELNCLTLLCASQQRDPKSIGSLLKWCSEQDGDVRNQLSLSQARANQLEALVREKQATLDSKENEIKALKTEIEILREQIAAAHETTRVQGVHMRSDLDKQRNRTLRVLDDEIPVLADSLTALEREPPKIAVARDYLGSAIDKLNEELRLLKGE